MNVESVAAKLSTLLKADTDIGVQGALLDLAQRSQAYASTTNHATQSQFNEGLQVFLKSINEMNLPQDVVDLLTEGGIAHLFTPILGDTISYIASQNSTSPPIIAHQIANLCSSRQNLLDRFKVTVGTLNTLGAPPAEPASTPRLTFIFPDSTFSGLADFSEMLKELSYAIRVFSEIASGTPEEAQLIALESTEPTITLGVNAETIVVVATVVKWALGVAKDVLNLRLSLRNLKRELPDLDTKEAESKLEDRLRARIDEAIPILLARYQGDDGRKHELANAAVGPVRFMFLKTESGMRVYVLNLPESVEMTQSLGWASEDVATVHALNAAPRLSAETLPSRQQITDQNAQPPIDP
ncbi:MAG TPA: hypothetical protein VG248_13685 [Caulobacteraceae bacterium]|jgi:hypothetical protein|nr:hypothetical protein [Caulobacteraceae bacterium]